MKIKTKTTFILSQSERQMTVSTRMNEGKPQSLIAVRGGTGAPTETSVKQISHKVQPRHFRLTGQQKDSRPIHVHQCSTHRNS